MIHASRAHLEAAALTHPGMAGRQNEDRFAVSAHRLSEKDPTRSVFAVVSDGIGGHRAGEVAAEMAVETISRMVSRSDASQPLAILDQAIQTTNGVIAAKARDDTQRLGMGTTCVCAWVIGDQLYTASVGDSRIYLLREDAILQLTVDHTWVQEAMEKGILQPGQARNHPNMHVIRRYLGSDEMPQADLRMRLSSDESDTQSLSNQGLHLLPDDLLLLCTDGLTDQVSDAEILATLHGPDPSGGAPRRNLRSAAQALVDLAVRHGAPDNITVVLLAGPEGTKPERAKSKFRSWWVWAALSLVLLSAAILLLGWLVLRVFLPPH